MGAWTIVAVNLLLTCVISSTVCNSGSKSECNSDRVEFIRLHSFRCGRLTVFHERFCVEHFLTHLSPRSCPSPCHPPFLLPPWQMESKKKRRKYSTSSNDSDTTDSKSERNTQMKFACVCVFFLYIFEVITWGFHSLWATNFVGTTAFLLFHT